MCLGKNGHIVVYHQRFESGVLGTLAGCVPEYRVGRPTALQKRLWDLLPVIRSHTYHMDYQGSFSLKDVLPALVPEMTYEGMEVAEGNAGRVGLGEDDSWPEVDDADKQEIARAALLAYCEQDTLAMVRLLDVLRAA